MRTTSMITITTITATIMVMITVTVPTRTRIEAIKKARTSAGHFFCNAR